MDTNYEDMLGLCKVGHIGTVMEHITCHSHNGSLRSLRIHQDDIHHILHSHSRAQPRPHACRSSHPCSHHILHGILRSRSRAQPQPHACHSSPSCSQDRILRIHHGSLRIHRIRSKAHPRPLACHSIPCILQDCIHHILCTRRIHRIRSKAQLQHLPRLQAQQPQGPPGRELRASSCCQLLEW